MTTRNERHFTRRVDEFWKWFSDNEARLADAIENIGKYGGEKVNALVGEGLDLIADEVFYNMGGDFEFNFAAEGAAWRFFLYDHVIARMPAQLRAKWRVNAGMPGAGEHNFGLRMGDIDVDVESFRVSMTIDEKDGQADLRFYNEKLAGQEKNSIYHAFFLMLDNAAGERLANTVVGEVELAEAPEADSFPMTELKGRLTEAFCKDGKLPDPAQRWSVYRREPRKQIDGFGRRRLRDDIFVGTTNCKMCFQHYHRFMDGKAEEGETPVWERFRAFGAEPVQIYWYLDENHPFDENGRRANDPLGARNAVWDRIEEEALGAGKDALGVFLGAAMGEERAYIDLLLFDPDAFQKRVVQVLGDEAIFFIAPFEPGAAARLLDPAPAEAAIAGNPGPLLAILETLNGFPGPAPVEAAVLIERLPKEARTLALVKQAARALMNNGRYAEALELLLGWAEEGAGDAVWNWRAGGSLYCLDRPAEAIPYLERAIALGDDDPETHLTLEAARRGIPPDELEERRALFGDGPETLAGELGDLETRLHRRHAWGHHRKIVEMIEAAPGWERDYDLVGLKARALNNLDREDEAASLLESVRAHGESDPAWLYRYAFAIFYGSDGREREAAALLEKALDIGGPDEGIQELLDQFRKYLDRE
jgi:tetratricopeptide (TPR) repeat protein